MYLSRQNGYNRYTSSTKVTNMIHIIWKDNLQSIFNISLWGDRNILHYASSSYRVITV